MNRPIKCAAMSATIAVSLVCSGCGGGGGSASPAGESPTEPATGPELHFADDLEPVCRGTGAPFATPYDSARAGIHKTAMLSGADVDDLSETSSSLNPEWIVLFSDQTDEYAKVELVVCSIRTATAFVKECTGYESDGEATENVVQLYSATYQVEVREASTAAVLGQTTVEAEATDCPGFVFFDADGNSEDWFEEDAQAIIDFAKPFVVT
jgi:hypothetical protein